MEEDWDVNLAGQVEIVGDNVEVSVAGEIDARGAATLQHRLEDLIASTIGTIVLDMHRVTFIDSMGIRALIEVHRHLRAQRRSLVLRELSAQARRVLDISGADQILEFSTKK